MKTYPTSDEWATRVSTWESDIAFTLRVAGCDPIHGPRAMRECLETIRRGLQDVMRQQDDADNACERCGAPPAAQLPRWERDPWNHYEGQCGYCGAAHVLQPITVRPIMRAEEDADVSF